MTSLTTAPPVHSYITPQTILSNLFRFASWIHLRCAPTNPQAHIFLLTLYGAASILLFSGSAPDDSPIPAVKVVAEANGVEKGNGHVVVEPVEIQRRGPDPSLRLLFSLPSRSKLTTISNFAINTLIALLLSDFAFRLHTSTWTSSDLTFARVGATYSDAVKIQVRYPNLHDEHLPLSDVGSLKVLWREASTSLGGAASEGMGGMWKDGPVLQLSEENDWVGIAHLTKLWPGYTYQFRLAHPNSSFLPYPSEPLSFKTFPDPRLRSGNKYSFVAGGGVRLNFPYDPLAPANAIKGLDTLHDRYFLWDTMIADSVVGESKTSPEVAEPEALAEAEAISTVADIDSLDPSTPVPPAEPSATADAAVTPKATSGSWLNSLTGWSKREAKHRVRAPAPPAFMLLLGDILPTTAPLPLKDAHMDAFRLFRNLYDSPSLRRLYEAIPVFHISGSSATKYLGTFKETQPSNSAAAYETYSLSANYPGYARQAYFDFKYGDTAFFVLDTSSHRSGPDAADYEQTLLGGRQLTDLHAWAAKVNQTAVFKVIVSPVPFSSMWPTSTSMWADYKDERQRLMEVLAYIPNIIIVSGGRLEFAAIEYSNGMYEFVTGPLSGDYVPASTKGPSELRSAVRHTETKLNVTIPGDVEAVEIIEVESVREETLLKSIRLGSSRWASFDIDTTTDKPKLTVEVLNSADGEPEWSYTIIGKTVALKQTNAVGKALTGGIKSVLGKMGFGKLL